MTQIESGPELLDLEAILSEGPQSAVKKVDGRSDELAGVARLLALRMLGERVEAAGAYGALESATGAAARAMRVTHDEPKGEAKVSMLQEIVRNHPDSDIARWLLAESAEGAGHWERARDLHRALVEETGSQLAILGLARCTSEMGSSREALDVLDKMRPEWRGLPYTLLVESRIAARARDWTRAIRAYSQRCGLLSLKPHPFVYRYSSSVLWATSVIGFMALWADIPLLLAACLMVALGFLLFKLHMRPVSRLVNRSVLAVLAAFSLLLVVRTLLE